MHVVQRKYPRKRLKASIQLSALTSNESHSSRLLNFSECGMCFQTDQQLELMTEVRIAMENYAPGRFGPEGYRFYLARVRWIQPFPALQSARFAAGAKIIARSHEDFTSEEKELRRTCDLCGVLMPASRLTGIDEEAQVCEHCHKHYLSLPQGKIRECLKRFMVGSIPSRLSIAA